MVIPSDRQVQSSGVLPPGREAVQPAVPGAGVVSRARVCPARRLRHGHHGRAGRLGSRKASGWMRVRKMERGVCVFNEKKRRLCVK